MPRKLLVALFAVVAMGMGAQTAQAAPVKLETLSSKAHQVSGGDALVRVDGPADTLGTLRIERNGTDVTAAFSPEDGGRHGCSHRLAGTQGGRRAQPPFGCPPPRTRRARPLPRSRHDRDVPA